MSAEDDESNTTDEDRSNWSADEFITGGEAGDAQEEVSEGCPDYDAADDSGDGNT